VQESFFEAIGIRQFHVRLAKFPKPFQESFAYGNIAMNLNHPIAQALLHLISIAYVQEGQWKIPVSELKAMRLILKRIISLPGAILSEYSSWADSTNDLWNIANKVGLASHLGIRTLTPTLDQFVPGSTEQFLDVKVNDNWDRSFGDVVK
jgi:hypothetical protein